MEPMTIDPAAFAAAVDYAGVAHVNQYRKRRVGDTRPPIGYVSHLLAVAAIVIEDGGGLDEAIAGLLHDVIEDQDPDDVRTAEIENRFGPAVLSMVQKCSGPKKEDPGMADFRVRKQIYLDHLGAEDDGGAITVSLADKVHNARCTINDLEAEGPTIFDKFNSGAVDQLWWYDSLAGAYLMHARAGRADKDRAAELARLVRRMHELVLSAG